MKLKSNLTDTLIKALKELGLIEEEQPVNQQPWEKYPDYKSCWNETDIQYYFTARGNIDGLTIDSDDVNKGRLFYGFSSEAHAKRVRAEMILKRIADKWNEVVEKEQYNFYTVSLQGDNKIVWGLGDMSAFVRPIRFNTRELAEKSLEMFPELWDDYLKFV